jgi:hypothetical protein
VFDKGESITSAAYINVLKTFLPKAPTQMVFQQDNARPHTAAATIEFLNQRKVKFVPDWPARSPDLSPIETCWALVQKRASAMRPQCEDELKECVLKAWKELPQTTINALVFSFKKRIKKCIELRGKPVK